MLGKQLKNNENKFSLIKISKDNYSNIFYPQKGIRCFSNYILENSNIKSLFYISTFLSPKQKNLIIIHFYISNEEVLKYLRINYNDYEIPLFFDESYQNTKQNEF